MKRDVMEYADFADVFPERLRRICGQSRDVFSVKAGMELPKEGSVKMALEGFLREKNLFEGRRLLKDCVVLVPKNRPEVYSPVLITLEDLYRLYQLFGMKELEKKLLESIQKIEERYAQGGTAKDIWEYAKIRDRLFLMPMSEEEAREKGYLHVTELDIALAVAFIEKIQGNEIITGIVPANMAELWEKSAEEAAADAFAAMYQRGHPALAVFSPGEETPWLYTENAEAGSLPAAGRRDIAVLRSGYGSCGICALYYPGMLRRLSVMLGGDMILLIDRSLFVFAAGSGMDPGEVDRFRKERFKTSRPVNSSWYLYRATEQSLTKGGELGK